MGGKDLKILLLVIVAAALIGIGAIAFCLRMEAIAREQAADDAKLQSKVRAALERAMPTATELESRWESVKNTGERERQIIEDLQREVEATKRRREAADPAQ
jgi:hypothetical protein